VLEICLLWGYISSCVPLWEIEDKTEFAFLFTSCKGGNENPAQKIKNYLSWQLFASTSM